MGLQVIGAGWSRTGTFSLRKALSILGFGPCYHMHDVFERREHHALWRQAAAGKLDDWEAILGGYQSVTDAPPCLFWRELSARYPDASVVVTVRDPMEWYESMRSTVYEAMLAPERVPGASESDRAALDLARELVLDGYFKGQFADRDAAIARFREHNEAVQAEIPPARLLAYDVREGWGPLCAFLGAEVPELPFPRTNERAQFRERIGLDFHLRPSEPNTSS
jgi:hypothetical protein